MPIRTRRGKLHYRFQVNGRTYQGPTGLDGTERNRIAAMRIEAKNRELVLEGRGNELKLTVVPFIEAADRFLAWADSEYQAHPNTAKRLRVSFASLTAFLNRQSVVSIGAGVVEDYKAWRRREHEIKDVTLRHDLHALSVFFRYARKQNWARTNPVKEVSIPSDKEAVRIHVLTAAEEHAYFAAAARWPNLHDIGRLMLNQGCRPEEVMELDWDHVNLEAGKLTIASGKTPAAQRTLKLTPDSRTLLAARLARRGLSPWVFPSPLGGHITTLQGSHGKALAASGTKFVLYDLRHTFATRAAAKIPLPALMAILGHSNLRTVMRYVHVQQGSMDAAMDTLSAPVAAIAEGPIAEVRAEVSHFGQRVN